MGAAKFAHQTQDMSEEGYCDFKVRILLRDYYDCTKPYLEVREFSITPTSTSKHVIGSQYADDSKDKINTKHHQA